VLRFCFRKHPSNYGLALECSIQNAAAWDVKTCELHHKTDELYITMEKLNDNMQELANKLNKASYVMLAFHFRSFFIASHKQSS
jgi:hypothetical protein